MVNFWSFILACMVVVVIIAKTSGNERVKSRTSYSHEEIFVSKCVVENAKDMKDIKDYCEAAWVLESYERLEEYDEEQKEGGGHEE